MYSLNAVAAQIRVVSPIVVYLFLFAFFTEGEIAGIAALLMGILAVVLGLALFLEGSASCTNNPPWGLRFLD